MGHYRSEMVDVEAERREALTVKELKQRAIKALCYKGFRGEFLLALIQLG